jgi:hypothetical protein
MRLFKCQHCGQVLYFENTACERCGHALGYLPERSILSALEPDGDQWRPLAGEAPRRLCANAAHGVCNWLADEGAAEGALCVACRHNRTIPDLSVPENLADWRTLELAKHRLFYTLIRLGLPIVDRVADPAHGLAFDFPAETSWQPHVMTGHDEGLITIALKEADEEERTRMRAQMGELYRTPLGHFRHEVGHYYWDVLIRDGGRLEEFRAVFGDERADYGEALQAHYARPPAPDWQEHFVSVYAGSHPWEDWAETWAHYLHILDTLEMAASFGLSVHPRVSREESLQADLDFDPHRAEKIETIIDAWLPLTFAMNSLNRAMGQNDVYPFVLAPAVVEKLGFVHRVVRENRAASA